MRIPVFLAAILTLIPVATPVSAQHDHSAAETESPYADLAERTIASLSDDDVVELLAGGGWGFALPAELNGLPGPRHVLDLADELELSEHQRIRTQELFDSMRARATELGALYVSRERHLDAYFEAVSAGELRGEASRLNALVDSVGTARSELRTVHLEAHFGMMDVLTPEQVEAYSRLRGYAKDDPCAQVPEGHDPELWRRHNSCEG